MGLLPTAAVRSSPANHTMGFWGGFVWEPPHLSTSMSARCRCELSAAVSVSATVPPVLLLLRDEREQANRGAEECLTQPGRRREGLERLGHLLR